MNFKWLTQRKALPIIIASCLLIAVLMVKLQPTMQHEPEAGLVTTVKVIEPKQYRIKPAIKGYGIVEPDILFEAKSEISGKITYIHPQLRDGAIFPKDTVVIRIEVEDYQLSVQQAKADSSVGKAKLREIKVKLNNTRHDLKLAKQKLVLAEKELQRYSSLLDKRLVAQSHVDTQQSNVLKLKQEVQNLNSLLRTLPEQQASLEASLTNTEAAVQTEQRNLQRTTINMPFNARIAELVADENQYITPGTVLFKAQTIDKILINAQFPLDKFRTLAKDFADSEALIRQAFQTGFSKQLFTQLGLSATVRLADFPGVQWQANVERFSSSLDPVTRTLGIIVSVDKPFENIKPGIKPPLIEGMYTEIMLQGKAKNYFLIPRDTLHEGELFFADKDNKLQRRQLKPTLLQNSMALFNTGITAPDKVIVSDIFPAVSGMTLNPLIDESLQQQIAQWAETQQ
jgi:multidrug efflux pump subunit AcrA (membrane-fusion protein)